MTKASELAGYPNTLPGIIEDVVGERFGVGKEAPVLTSDDFDAMTDLGTGTYTVLGTFANGPDGTASYVGLLRVTRRTDDEPRVIQELATGGRWYSREADLSGEEPSWGAWREGLTTDRLASEAEALAGTENAKAMTPLRARQHGDDRYLQKSQNLAGVDDPEAARANLGLGSAATQNDDRYAHRANNLGDLDDAAAARGNLDVYSKAEADGAVSAAMPVGALLMGFYLTAPAGFLMLDGKSLGDTGSGADHEGAGLEALYKHLWANLDDTEAPVAGGRGDDADADWSARKALTMPDMRGRSPLGAGAGTGLTARILGETLGSETHELAVDELPSHAHNATSASAGSHTHSLSAGSETTGSDRAMTTSASGGSLTTGSGGAHTHTITVDNTGGGQPHNNMQPSLAVSFFIKT